MKKIRTSKKKKIRVRFAPSPTGFLHIGGARTALVNYLFTKSKKGTFVLRIDDTDKDRLVENSVNDIMESLRWLSLGWDEGPKVGGSFKPYYQSKRLPLYKKYIDKLIEEGKAYCCFCSPARLEILKRTQMAQGKLVTRYDGRCKNLTSKQITDLKKSRKKYVVRFKAPKQKEVKFNDLLKGPIKFKKEIDDFVLLRSDGYPTYHLASVIDDYLMKITHIIRGDEWVSSTPKHILLYDALGWKHPYFVHLPAILSPRGGKLSKREGAVSIKDFREKGYLPEAIINFIIFLGWNSGTAEEIFSLKELIKRFSIERMGSSPGVFDVAKLNYLNGYYIRAKTEKELLGALKDFNPKISKLASDNFLLKIIKIERDRMVTLNDFVELTHYFFNVPKYDSDILIFKKSNFDKTLIGLKASLSYLADLSELKWSEDSLNKVLTEIVKENNLSNGDVFWPIRAALSGLEASPSPTELLFVLGKKESLKRIKKAIGFLTKKK